MIQEEAVGEQLLDCYTTIVEIDPNQRGVAEGGRWHHTLTKSRPDSHLACVHYPVKGGTDGDSCDVYAVGPHTARFLQHWSDHGLDLRRVIRSRALLKRLLDAILAPQHVTMAQCHEMIVTSERHHHGVTLGDVCTFSAILSQGPRQIKALMSGSVRAASPSSPKLPFKSSLKGRKASDASSHTSTLHEVFLGGSCNPTTWRQDVAIPLLKELGVTFYNPQVNYWVPELIELEQRAKDSAKVMLFVIDRETRGIASMIEASHIAGARKQLVLVVDPLGCLYSSDGETTPTGDATPNGAAPFGDDTPPIFDAAPDQEIFGERLSRNECVELARSRAYLRDLVEMSGMCVFSDLRDAVRKAAELVKSNQASSTVRLFCDNTQDTACVSVTESTVEVWQAFDTYGTLPDGRLTLQETKMAFRAVTGGKSMPDDLKEQLSRYTERGVDLLQFSILVAEYRLRMQQVATDENNSSRWIQMIKSFVEEMVIWLRQLFSPEPSMPLCSVISKDVYIGGSVHRQSEVISLLLKQGLTYSTPLKEPWRRHVIPREMASIAACRCILFIISDSERALGDMILASHFIGSGFNMVLCVQRLPDSGVVIDGEELTPTAIKDYNRGRMYFTDMANRHNVRIYQNVEEATEYVIQEIRASSS